MDALQDRFAEEGGEESEDRPHPLKQSYVVKVLSSKEGAGIWVKDKVTCSSCYTNRNF